MKNGLTSGPTDSSEFALADPLKQLSIDLFAKLEGTSLDGIGISRETYGASETAAFELIERFCARRRAGDRLGCGAKPDRAVAGPVTGARFGRDRLTPRQRTGRREF